MLVGGFTIADRLIDRHQAVQDENMDIPEGDDQISLSPELVVLTDNREFSLARYIHTVIHGFIRIREYGRRNESISGSENPSRSLIDFTQFPFLTMKLS